VSVYLDHAATTPLVPGVLEAMLPFLGHDYGNPSSVHEPGRRARAAVDEARDSLATVLRCLAREIVFTGSGTEADNLALRGVLERHGAERGRHLVVSAIEHEAVLQTAQRLAETGAAELTVVGCDAGCVVQPDEVAAAVRPDTVLVSLMLLNNETGVVQDVAAVADAVRRRNPRTLVHTDSVQALARREVHPAALGVDLASFSAHKLGGPKGCGALWVRDGVALAAVSTGGGQERGRRSGTENVAGIVGFAAAASRADANRTSTAQHQAALGSRLLEAMGREVPDAVLLGDADRRVPGIACYVVPGARSDVLLTALDRAGVAASGGSACSSGAPTPSHVLLAMGLPADLAMCQLRLSLGEGSREQDIDLAATAISAVVERIRGVPLLR
jgi:cysteine desulfurase